MHRFEKSAQLRLSLPPYIRYLKIAQKHSPSLDFLAQKVHLDPGLFWFYIKFGNLQRCARKFISAFSIYRYQKMQNRPEIWVLEKFSMCRKRCNLPDTPTEARKYYFPIPFCCVKANLDWRNSGLERWHHRNWSNQSPILQRNWKISLGIL